MKWTKNKVVDQLRLIKKTGRKINSFYLQKHYSALRGAISKLFDSYQDAIEYAGFDYEKEKAKSELPISGIKKLGTEKSIYSENKEIVIGRDALCKMASIFRTRSPASCYDYKDKNYFENSYIDRNAYRKKHKVREFDLKLLEDKI